MNVTSNAKCQCNTMRIGVDCAVFYVPAKHSIGYMGDGFTGQKTQPTVSKY